MCRHTWSRDLCKGYKLGFTSLTFFWYKIWSIIYLHLYSFQAILQHFVEWYIKTNYSLLYTVEFSSNIVVINKKYTWHTHHKLTVSNLSDSFLFTNLSGNALVTVQMHNWNACCTYRRIELRKWKLKIRQLKAILLFDKRILR